MEDLEADIKEVNGNLNELRDRRGKAPLTKEERIQRLNECLDGAIIWLQQSVIAANAKGVGAATLIIERCRLEINEIQRAGGSTNAVINVFFKPSEDDEIDGPAPELCQPVGQEETVS